MLERRIIRMLMPYSRSLYCNDNGRERGIYYLLGKASSYQFNTFADFD
jgi:hypothetical protein